MVQKISERIQRGSPSIRFIFDLIFSRFVLFVLVLFLAGCPALSRTGSNKALRDFARDPLQEARINSFLVLDNPDAPGLRLEISKIEILANDLWLPLLREPLTIDSAKLGAGQLFLGGQNVPPGDYRRMRIIITRGEAQNNLGEYVEIASEPFLLELRLTAPLTLNLDDSAPLLLTWDVENSLETGDGFQPEITVAPPSKEILRDLVFVSCPKIDTVFVVRADNNWVVNSFGLKGAPTYMALDPDASNQRLFVLASRDRMIKVVDLTTYRVVEFFAVPLNDDPTFMTVSADGRNLYLLDEKSGYLSRIDTDTGRNQARVLLKYRPSYMLVLPQRGQLAVSLSLSQEVALLDPVNLRNTGTISTGSSPQGLLIDGNQLYIAESGDNSVAISDLSSLGNLTRLPVGLGPRRLIASDNQIYVGNAYDGTLSVLGTGGLGVVQDIFGLGRPGEMVLDQFYRRLYIADEEIGALSVIDVNANRLIGHIELGAKPLGMAVIQ